MTHDTLRAAAEAALAAFHNCLCRDDDGGLWAGKHGAEELCGAVTSLAHVLFSQEPPAAAPRVQFDDPRVQKVYDILADTDDVPPPEQHWEGWRARRIVDALFPAAAPAQGEPFELTDERIDHIADLVVKGMPEGIRGFCVSWGWRQFARAILEDCRGHVRAIQPQAEQFRFDGPEGAEFEAWWTRRVTEKPFSMFAEAAWRAWQARAALPHPPTEGSKTE